MSVASALQRGFSVVRVPCGAFLTSAQLRDCGAPPSFRCSRYLQPSCSGVRLSPAGLLITCPSRGVTPPERRRAQHTQNQTLPWALGPAAHPLYGRKVFLEREDKDGLCCKRSPRLKTGELRETCKGTGDDEQTSCQDELTTGLRVEAIQAIGSKHLVTR
ncbi:hypothetical protein AAY473_040399 [Plecturocebus cupreus]